MHAWDHFYADTDGIQTELVKSWAAVATSFAGDPAVAGYDLLNEPNWGTDVDSSGAKLGAFYQRDGRGHPHRRDGRRRVLAHRVLRAGRDLPDPRHAAAGQRRERPEHGVRAAQLPRVDATPAPSSRASPPRRRPPPPTAPRSGSASTAGSATAPRTRPRWPASPRPRTRPWWAAPGGSGARPAATPTRSGQRGGTPADTIVEFNLNGCPGDKNLGPVPEWFPILTRGYPRSSPGRLTSLRADGPAGTVSLSGEGASASADARLVVWVPDRGHGLPRIGGQGLSDVTHTTVPGGWLVSARRLQGRLLVDRRTERARALLVVRHVAAERQHLGRARVFGCGGCGQSGWSR